MSFKTLIISIILVFVQIFSMDAQVDLELSMTIDNINPVQNSYINVTLTLSNNGSVDATGVEVVYNIPSGFAHSSNSAPNDYFPWNGEWTIGTVSPGSPQVLVVTLYVNDVSQDFTHWAQVTNSIGSGDDSTPNNGTFGEANEDDEEFVITNAVGGANTGADLSLDLDAGQSTFILNEELVFTLTLTNDGPESVNNVEVYYDLPNGFDYESSSSPIGNYDILTNIWTITQELGGTGLIGTLNITATANQDAVDVTHFAQVYSSPSTDPDSNPNNAPSNTVAEDDESSITLTPISSNSNISITNNIINPTASAPNSGSVNLTVSGGTTPYAFVWSNGSTTEDITGLPEGNYTVTVTDSSSPNEEIIETFALVNTTGTGGGGCTSANQNITPWNVHMTGFSFGEISNINQSNPNSWNPTSPGYGDYTNFSNSIGQGETETVSIPSNISWSGAGDYYWKIWIDLNQDGAFSASELVFNQTQNYANGVHNPIRNGSISIPNNATIGSTTMRVIMSKDDTENACASGFLGEVEDYTLQITAGDGQTTPIVLTNTTIDPTASSPNSGSIDLSVSGGTNPYTFIWSSGATTEDITGLTEGTYTVTVTDVAGDTASESITLTAQNNSNPLVLSTIFTNPTTTSPNNGSIDLIISGGTTPYSYVWNNGSITQNLSGLNAGSYTVTVTDINNLQETETVILTEEDTSPPQVCTPIGTPWNEWISRVQFSEIDKTSEKSNPYADFTNEVANVTKGTVVPITITSRIPWVSNPTEHWQVWIDFNQDGAYSSSERVLQEERILPTDDNTEEVNGNISIPVSAVTGITTMRVMMSRVSVAPVCSDDFLGEAEEYSVNISGDAAPLSLIYSSTNPTNQSTNDGSIDITVSGGNGSYSYAWSTGATTEDITGLTEGTYTITVTDGSGDTVLESITLTAGSNSSPLVITSTVTNPETNSPNSGAIDISITGGTQPYTYLWNTSATTEDLSGLSVGTYSITVTDNGSQTASETFNLQIPEPCDPGATPWHEWITGVQFSGISNSPQSSPKTQGVANYTSFSATVDAGSNYDIIINSEMSYLSETTDYIYSAWIDYNGDGDFTDSNELVLELNKAYGAGAQVNSETGSISIPSDVEGTTTMRVVLHKTNGSVSPCETMVSGEIEDYTVIINPMAIPDIDVTITAINPSFYEGNDGSITLFIEGGTMPYSINWTGGLTGINNEDLSAGDYIYTVTDANGETVSDTITLISPDFANVVWQDTSANVFFKDTTYIKKYNEPAEYFKSCNTLSASESGFVSFIINEDIYGSGDWFYVGLVRADKELGELQGTQDGDFLLGVRDTSLANTPIVTTENGENVTPINETINIGDEFRVEKSSDGTITYKKNGVVIHTSIVSAANTDLKAIFYTYFVGADEKNTVNIYASFPCNDLSVSVEEKNIFDDTASGEIKLNAAGGMPPYTYIWSDIEEGSFFRDSLRAGEYLVTISDRTGQSRALTINLYEFLESEWTSIGTGVDTTGGIFNTTNNNRIDNILTGCKSFSPDMEAVIRVKLNEDLTGNAEFQKFTFGFRDVNTPDEYGFYGLSLNYYQTRIVQNTETIGTDINEGRDGRDWNGNYGGYEYEARLKDRKITYTKNHKVIYVDTLPLTADKIRIDLMIDETGTTGIDFDIYTNIPCTPPIDESYATVKRKLDGAFTESDGQFLRFKFLEDYNTESTDEIVSYKIYNWSHSLELAGTISNATYGANWYELDLIYQGLSLNKFYTLELLNNKGEKHYLRFKYTSSDCPELPCQG